MNSVLATLVSLFATAALAQVPPTYKGNELERAQQAALLYHIKWQTGYSAVDVSFTYGQAPPPQIPANTVHLPDNDIIGRIPRQILVDKGMEAYVCTGTAQFKKTPTMENLKYVAISNCEGPLITELGSKSDSACASHLDPMEKKIKCMLSNRWANKPYLLQYKLLR